MKTMKFYISYSLLCGLSLCFATAAGATPITSGLQLWLDASDASTRW